MYGLNYYGEYDQVIADELEGLVAAIKAIFYAEHNEDGSHTFTVGDVGGPAGAVDDRIATFDGTSGKVIQDSGVTVADILATAASAASAASPNVTLAGTPDYITIAGQVITRGLIDLTTDVTGDLPLANLAQGSALSVLGVTGNATADNASIVAGSDHQVLRRSGTAVGFGAVNLAQAAAVTGILPLANVAPINESISARLSTVGDEVFVECPFDGTITAARIVGFDSTGASLSGSAVVDVWKDTYASYPPTVADTITASAKPTLSSAIKNQDTTLTGWTTSVSAGDWFVFKLDSMSTIAGVLVQLTILRS